MALITSGELKKRIAEESGLVLLDVRTETEVADGHIPGAVWMDASSKDFMTKIKELPKEKTYCIYCASGGRTMMIAPFMEMNGFSHVYELEGGILEWMAEGNAVE